MTCSSWPTLDAVVAFGGVAGLDDLRRVVNAAPSSVDAAVERLLGIALLWGTPDALRALSAVGEAIGTPVSGLGPSFEQLVGGYGPTRVSEIVTNLGLVPTGDRAKDIELLARHLSDPEVVAELVAGLEPAGAKVLDHLDRSNAEGTVGTSESTVAPLLDLGLLVQRDSRHVTVAREVAVSLRGGRTTRLPVDVPPTLATAARDAALVDRASAGAAFEAVRHVELLLEHWGAQPPRRLRAGGVGVRDLKAAAVLLHLDERSAALLIEMAAAAGLLAIGHTDELDAAWLPTEAFDHWLALPVADRWTRLALAWLDNPRLTGLVGARLQGKVVNALGPDLERSWLAVHPPRGPARARRPRTRHRARHRHGHPLARRTAALAAAPASRLPLRGCGLGGRGGRGHGRRRRSAGFPGTAGRWWQRTTRRTKRLSRCSRCFRRPSTT